MSLGRHEVRPVKKRAEFDAVMSCQWDAFRGTDSFFDVWFPVGTGIVEDPDALQAAFDESADRLWKEHVEDPYSRWFYIADYSKSGDQGGFGIRNEAEDDGQKLPFVTGSCQWRVYPPPVNPFAAGVQDFPNPAWPRGSEGELITRWLVRQIVTPRAHWMAKPHVGLSWMAVRPSYQRCGIGSSLMHFGVQSADDLGLESFIEASDEGKLLYSRFGFEDIATISGVMPPASSGNDGGGDDNGEQRIEERKALEKRFRLESGYRHTAMWRPVKGMSKDQIEELWKQNFAIFDSSK